MDPFQPCSDMSDLTSLSLSHQLYLKPEAKLNITVALPSVTLPGKTISNWEVMERLRQAAEPDQFQLIKVNKSTLEFIRFDGEIENRSQIQNFINRLDGKVIRLSGFPEPLKVRAAEAKPEFPTRYDWDKFFRDAKNMNEMKAGERPDTITIQGLPSKWFASKRNQKNGSSLPCESVLQKVFEAFGEIRHVDIPMLDPHRNNMKPSISGIKCFTHSTDSTFDAFVQYREYISFVKAMDSLRGMKLVHRDGDKVFSSSIKVDFDKTKHLSDMTIHRRRLEREKLIEKDREKEEAKRREEDAVRRALEDEQKKKEEEKRLKGMRRKEREEKRKQRILKKLKKKEAEQMNIKIAIEERKLLMAQRKLESIRLLDELFERVKIERQKEITKEKEMELEEQLTKVKLKKEQKILKKEEKNNKNKVKMVDREKQLRRKLVKKIKTAQEQQMEERREKLRKTIEGKVKVKTNGPSAPLPLPHAHLPGPGTYNPRYENPYDTYGGYGYDGWISRDMYRGRFLPRRPPRGFRGYHHSFAATSKFISDWPDEGRPVTKSAADDVDDISSNAVSSATSDYSNLGSSDDEKKKDKKDIWLGYEGMVNPDGNPTHPWVGYSDFYNPRFMRRGGRRPRGPFRGGGGRGGFGPSPNPNVPTNSFYMQSINEQYYRYFNKLAKGEDSNSKGGKRSRSRSSSSERVVCRKVLSRSRSRGKSYSRSQSRSSTRSKSRSRSRSKNRSASRSRSRSKKRSASRSRSRSKRTSRSKSRSRRSTPSKSNSKPRSSPPSQHNKKENQINTDNSSCKVAPILSQTTVEEVSKDNQDECESDLSLSLSGSTEWPSPERKAKPLGNPNWKPSDSSRYQRGRSYYEQKYSKFRPRYESRDRPQVRSQVSRAERTRSKSRSRSCNRTSKRDNKSSRNIDQRRSSSRHKSPHRPNSSNEKTHRKERSKRDASPVTNKKSVEKKEKRKKKHEKKKKPSRSASRS